MLHVLIYTLLLQNALAADTPFCAEATLNGGCDSACGYVVSNGDPGRCTPPATLAQTPYCVGLTQPALQGCAASCHNVWSPDQGKCADDTRPETFCDVLLRTFHGCDPACGYHWALTKDKYYKENHVTGDELVGGRNVREHADNGGAVVHKLQGECLQTATQNGSPKSSYCEQVYSNKGCSVACGLNWSARQHVCQIGGLADEL